MEPTKHEGKLLTEYFVVKGISKVEICNRLSISQHALTYHTNRTNLSNKFKARLLSGGISLFKNEKAEYQFLLEYNKELEEKINMLNDVINLQKQFITHVTKNCGKGNCLNFVLDRTSHKELSIA